MSVEHRFEKQNNSVKHSSANSLSTIIGNCLSKKGVVTFIATLLKKMPWRPQGLEKLAQWKTFVGNIPLVAIGGLTPERADGVFAAGADSICVVTDVQQHSNPVDRVQQWLELCSKKQPINGP